MSWSGKWRKILTSPNWARPNQTHVSLSPILFSSSSAYTLCRKIVRALGDKLEKAFKDPIEEIKQEFGLIEENFFEDEEI